MAPRHYFPPYRLTLGLLDVQSSPDDDGMISRWIAFSVLCALFLGLVLGLMVPVGRLAEPSDWLSFLGSMLGSIVTVLGAFLVIYWQQHRAELQHREHLETRLESIRRFAERISTPQSHHPLTRSDARLATLELLKDTITALKDARKWAPPNSESMAHAYTLIERLDADFDKLERLIPIAEHDLGADASVLQKCKWIEEAATGASRLLTGRQME